jgi:diaminopimelate epimerase
LNQKKLPPIKIKTWGGDSLIVNFEIENQRIRNLSLTGPAKLVFSGEIEI